MNFNSHLPILPNFLLKNKEEEVVDDPKAELDDQKLWKEFSDFGTEMVITKNGRRMFPTIRIKLTGLHPKSRYIVMIELLPTDTSRYKFCNGSWIASGRGDFEPIRAPFVHPDSTQTGAYWMSMGASFKMLKLSNNHLNNQGYIFLNSMHRYHPRFHIVRCDQFDKAIISTFRSFVFKHTDFMAVTAYQNHYVTKKKIDHNPFAKGFRNKSKEKEQREKRRREEVEEVKDTPPASEDEEPEAKKIKMEKVILNQFLPEIPMDLMAQLQMAIITSFGNMPVLNTSTSYVNPVKKGGFGVLDLLSDD